LVQLIPASGAGAATHPDLSAAHTWLLVVQLTQATPAVPHSVLDRVDISQYVPQPEFV
jgi:hypothetical protein